MNTLELARLQFGITTVFHFIFVPMSIGLAVWVAYCQTRWLRSRDEVWLRMTRFWGKLMLLSIAVGVVTGIVQEFQFGMNWSVYSRYVGDVFGAPLAMEGLAAFFLESTFVGLWIFGWGRISPRLHLMAAWLTAIGTALSAYFILAANSWMQHPVGYKLDPVTHHAVLTNIFAVLFNSTVLLAFPHTIFGAFTTAGALVLGISMWYLVRGRNADVFRRSARLVLPITLVTAIATGVFGDSQARLMDSQQPMKMAAAEALYNSSHHACFSLFATAGFTRHPQNLSYDLCIPDGLSLLATLNPDGLVKGINQVNAAERRKYGPGDYVPIVGVTYWSFRIMSGIGVLLILLPLAGMLLARRGRLERSRWYYRAALVGIFLPILANWSGWIFTEMGRQPWVVYGLLKTSQARSPDVSAASIAISLAAYVVLYGVLIAIGGKLFVREIKHGPQEPPADGDEPGGAAHDLLLAY
ncbi:MAG TPA: cytochrome ubiquinol oxidase subunit I [Solirubrobacteraceae bacterium]|nr:cytochrome ubiquinol oxidase subunit I [Solirubrobacteraceae bacterium]